ncbi:MAG: acetylglutamate kinase [Elusimicrobia bacterium]|nr:acetylglutamate kinase [Elusimicrobiota bacterium]MBU2614790.1 acetylglutamate kinase [Elusimicrobiota bacterium]
MSKIIVIKYGGNATQDKASAKKILKDIVSINKNNPVLLVHGGGPQISKMMNESGIKPMFINGLRYTDIKTMQIVEKALKAINDSIVSRLNKTGGFAFGISCREGNLITSKRIKKLGYVGNIVKIDTKLPVLLFAAGIIPVIMPVSQDFGHTALNLNADTAATQLAAALEAQRLVFLTDVPGVKGPDGKIIKIVRAKNIEKMIKSGIVTGGMMPKLRGAAAAIKKGIKQVQITDGKNGVNGKSGTVII